MKKLSRKLFVFLASLSIVVSVLYFFQVAQNKTVYAVGDLNVEWGVPDGDPIFVVNNMLPGDEETREVDVINNGTSTRPVSIKGVKTSETLDFSTILDFAIYAGATPIYGDGSSTGPKTLEDFFTESADANGIFLSDLNASDSTTYTFKVIFPTSAGNEFQNASVIFDLIISMSFDVPAECSHIDFAGDPIFGTSLGDNINGGPGNDLIFGLEGGDSINGNGGDDCIVGGEGGDSLRGNSENDVIFGNEGGDTIKGENGEDLLIGGDGGDSIKGGNENDRIFGNEGNDGLEGENGDDYLDAGDGDDSLFGGAGNDELIAGPGKDNLVGGSGDDRLISGDGVDSAEGGPGNDYVEGNEGDDGLYGGPGDDILIGGPGIDLSNGDPGTDTCDAETENSCEL